MASFGKTNNNNNNNNEILIVKRKAQKDIAHMPPRLHIYITFIYLENSTHSMSAFTDVHV